MLRGVASEFKDPLLNGISTQASHCKSVLITPIRWITKWHFFFEKDYLDHLELARDVLRIKIFYWERGYREATVDTTVTPPVAPKVQVTFTVQPGPATMVTAMTVEPESVLTRHERKGLTLRPGRRLDLAVVDSTRQQILDALWHRGYYDATVDTTIVLDPAANAAAVHFVANRKQLVTIGRITVEGNKRIDSTTIRNALAFDPGDLLLHSDVDKSQRTLYESGLFRRASLAVLPDTGAPDSVRLVQVNITEGPLHAVQGSVGLNQINFIQLGGQYTNYDWLGNARQLTINASVGNLLATALNNHVPFYDVAGLAQKDDPFNTGKYLQPTWTVGLSVLQPWLGGPNNSVGGGVFDTRQSFPGIDADNSYGAQVNFTRYLAEHIAATLSYRYELTQVSASDVYFCVNYGACDVPTISLLQGRRTLSPATLSMTWDATGGAKGPSDGAIARVEIQHASQYTLSDYRYDRASGWISVYRPVGRRSVLAMHAQLGWVQALKGGIDSAALHPRTRFYAGGAESVRGFGENQLGPEVLLISDSTLAQVCGMPINPSTCNPNGTFVANGKTVKIPNSAFTPSPLGGSTLAEASVEYRYPLFGNFGGAVFVDGGFVGQNSLNVAASGQGGVTPGVGIRYFSPVGPVRLDLGFNPSLTRSLPVVTQVGSGRTATIVELGTTANPTLRSYTPPGFFNALVLHISIGEAF